MFGVIPIWRVTRTFSEEELESRTKKMNAQFFEKQDQLKDEIKQKVLQEISLAMRMPPQRAENA